MSQRSDPEPAANDALETALGGSVEGWLGHLASRDSEIAGLLGKSWNEQVGLGYANTLREICQQPVTWLETAARVASCLPAIAPVLAASEVSAGRGAVVFTGSGSSIYAGECLALPLQERLGVSAAAIPAGQILTHPAGSLPPSGKFLVVSLARSGNSPESRGVIDLLLESAPLGAHLILTCNRQGALATAYGSAPNLATVVLDDKTDDRSLVMTSSFTNLVLAGRILSSLQAVPAYAARARVLARTAGELLLRSSDPLAQAARSGFGSAVYLGSGCRLGSAREAALKMLEMNAGEVATFSESYLGLRHGPMSGVHDDTLVVAFLSSDPVVRAYEVDLVRELDRKDLGARKVIVGSSVPAELLSRPQDLAVECGDGLTDEDLTILDVVVGQLLAFFRCLNTGFRPDSPSADGVINRVVSGFEIHKRSS
jgi:tagatose-6-phosphate ketose/aldose isomerase